MNFVGFFPCLTDTSRIFRQPPLRNRLSSLKGVEDQMSVQHQSSLVDTFDLSFAESIPKHLAHKSSQENVFLTDIKRHGENWFLCGGRVPQTHCFFNIEGRPAASDLLFYF